LELNVVLAIFNRSSLNLIMSWELSLAKACKVSLATSLAILHPLMICCGWIFIWINFSPSLNNSPAKTATVVVPSPTSSSWVFEISKYFFSNFKKKKKNFRKKTYQNLCGWVVHMHGFQNRGAIIGYGDVFIPRTSSCRH